MARLPHSLRALVLLPLLVAGVDQARVAMACGDAQTCLGAAAGSGPGPLAAVVLIAIAGGLLLVRLVRRRAVAAQRPRAAGAAARWLTAAAVAGAVLAAQLAVSGADAGGWAEALPLLLAAGAVLALVLRVVPRLRLTAPRRCPSVAPVISVSWVGSAPARRLGGLLGAGRAPPLAHR